MMWTCRVSLSSQKTNITIVSIQNSHSPLNSFLLLSIYRSLLCSKLCRFYFHEYKLMLWDVTGQRFTSHVSASILQLKRTNARQIQSTDLVSMEEQRTGFAVYSSYREPLLRLPNSQLLPGLWRNHLQTVWHSLGISQQGVLALHHSKQLWSSPLHLSFQSTSGDKNESSQFGGWHGYLQEELELQSN